MRGRRSTTLLGGAVTALVFAGCATPGYNPSALESGLVRAGATPEQARCVTRALSNTYAEEQLGSHSAPLEKEFEKTRAILAKCDVTLPLQPR